jgi:hypothetical protein
MSLLTIAARVAEQCYGQSPLSERADYGQQQQQQGQEQQAAPAAPPAGEHQSGDPQTNGYELSLVLEPSSDEGEKIFSIKGMIDGQVISGKFSISVENGVFAGYNGYEPDAGTFDITQDEEGALQTVLDVCESELMEKGVIHN